MRKILWLLGISSLIILSSCRKERISIPFTSIQTPTNSPLKSIWFTGPQTGYAAGGEKFFHGEMLSTVDGGENWTSDTLTNKRLNALFFLPGTPRGFAVGYDGYYLTKPAVSSAWEFHGLSNATELNAVAFKNENEGIAVGGIGFRNGVIHVFSSNQGTIDTLIFPLDHELRDVCYLNDENVIAVGYGLVLSSNDAGRNWQPQGISGDFFFAVHFPDSQTGYIVGLYGMILKTTDGGTNWTKLRKARTIAGNNAKFRDVFFADVDNGYIVGDGGLFWKTTNGGDSWSIVEDMPVVDFHSIYVVGNTGFIAGDEGRIIKFQD